MQTVKNNVFECLAVLCNSCDCNESEYDDSGHSLKCHDCFFFNNAEAMNRKEYELPKNIEILLNMK